MGPKFSQKFGCEQGPDPMFSLGFNLWVKKENWFGQVRTYLNLRINPAKVRQEII